MKHFTKLMLSLGLFFVTTASLLAQTKQDYYNEQTRLRKTLADKLKAEPINYSLLPLEREITLSYQHLFKQDYSAQLNPFAGDKLISHSLVSRGYVKNKNGSIASGYATYERSTDFGIEGRDMLDHERFYPYFVTTNRGGDYQKEIYRIGGSHSFALGKWRVALDGAYRGGLAFRTADPRPENKVSDYELGIGASYQFKPYTLALFSHYNYYKQEFDIQIRQAGKKTLFYSMRGMGLYDYMYSETNDSYQRFLSSDKVSFGFSLYPNKLQGFSIESTASYDNMLAIHTHEREPNSLRRWELLTKANYLSSLGNLDYKLSYVNALSYARGRELQYEKYLVHINPNIIGYKLITSKANHSLLQLQHRMSADLDYKLAKAHLLSLAYDCEYVSFKERYMQDKYHFTQDKLLHRFYLAYCYQYRAFGVELNQSLAMERSLQSSRLLPTQGDKYPLNLYARYFNSLQQKDNYYQCGIKLRYDFAQALSLELQTSYVKSFGDLNYHFLRSQINLIF